ncbi:hypothetical protein GCM10010472_30630 [Pseudonocardia halophobica]|uniref:Uncharacterized protein n=1 Tax=Pseudonocardia halophobica TaxID=29401 RepID=A0A9W6KXZ1_9PSEU|nr:hypothetical protein [Pseudonocardia halophobica]GLL09322.1 hypothetical protein GCM10017577_04620 [Pseudonocardia halophobica]
MSDTGGFTADSVPDPSVVAWTERHQVPIYLGAIAAGLLVGLAARGAGPGLEVAINPVLGLLLYVTFLQVPARDLLRSLRALLGTGVARLSASDRPTDAQSCSPARPDPQLPCRAQLRSHCRTPSRSPRS